MSDVSSVQSHFPKPQEGFATTTSGSVSAGATTVGLNSVGSYSNGDVFVGLIELGVTGKEQALTGTVNTAGVSITNVVWTKGTNTTHAGGVTVVDYVTATHLAMMSKGILVEHNQDGTHGNITSSGTVQAATALKSDTVSEKTSAAGVTVDSLLIKDGNIRAFDKSVLSTDSNPYKFRAYRAAAANSGNGAYAKITFDTESFDTNSNFATGTYTVPVSGFYQLNARSQTSGASGNELIIAIYKNGVIISEGSRAISTNTQGGVVGSSVSDLLQLTAGDALDVYAYSNSTIALEVTNSYATYFSGFLVSRT